MYDLLASFGMHGVYMWLFGYDLSLAWRIVWIDNDDVGTIVWIDNDFSYPCHFLNNHVVFSFSPLFFDWCSCYLWL